MKFLGFDHVDTRVRSLALVETFYDRLMPELGLPHKRLSHVDERGDWFAATEERPYNTVEYFEPVTAGRAPCFIGFIEDRAMTPTGTRIAFRVAPDEIPAWHDKLVTLGAHNIERSEDMEGYPAVFFEDPAGTKLEVVARPPDAL